MITSHVERLHENLEELKPNFVPHHAELALNQDKVKLDPNYPEYLKREDEGQVLCVVLREAGRVVAYFVGFVAPGLHNQACLVLTMDIFWLHPDYRDDDSLTEVEAEMLCMQLFEAVKAEAQRRGVHRPFFGSKFHKSADALFEALGMTQVESYYSAWWGE
jgi:hypothetical protein